MSIEFPRSLVDVVVAWNMPMHIWLKTSTTTYTPCYKFYYVFKHSLLFFRCFQSFKKKIWFISSNFYHLFDEFFPSRMTSLWLHFPIDSLIDQIFNLTETGLQFPNMECSLEFRGSHKTWIRFKRRVVQNIQLLYSCSAVCLSYHRNGWQLLC